MSTNKKQPAAAPPAAEAVQLAATHRFPLPYELAAKGSQRRQAPHTVSPGRRPGRSEHTADEQVVSPKRSQLLPKVAVVDLNTLPKSNSIRLADGLTHSRKLASPIMGPHSSLTADLTREPEDMAESVLATIATCSIPRGKLPPEQDFIRQSRRALSYRGGAASAPTLSLPRSNVGYQQLPSFDANKPIPPTAIPERFFLRDTSPVFSAVNGDGPVEYNPVTGVWSRHMFPSMHPTSREEAVYLNRVLDILLEELQVKQLEESPSPTFATQPATATPPHGFSTELLQELDAWSIVFAEGVRQAFAQCEERGVLFERVRVRLFQILSAADVWCHTAVECQQRAEADLLRAQKERAQLLQSLAAAKEEARAATQLLADREASLMNIVFTLQRELAAERWRLNRQSQTQEALKEEVRTLVDLQSAPNQSPSHKKRLTARLLWKISIQLVRERIRQSKGLPHRVWMFGVPALAADVQRRDEILRNSGWSLTPQGLKLVRPKHRRASQVQTIKLAAPDAPVFVEAGVQTDDVEEDEEDPYEDDGGEEEEFQPLDIVDVSQTVVAVDTVGSDGADSSGDEEDEIVTPFVDADVAPVPAGHHKLVMPAAWASLLKRGRKRVRPLPLGRVIQFVYNVLQDKIKADKLDRRQGAQPDAMPQYVVNYMLMNYGTRRLVQSRFSRMTETLRRSWHKHIVVDLFARMCGVVRGLPETFSDILLQGLDVAFAGSMPQLTGGDARLTCAFRNANRAVRYCALAFHYPDPAKAEQHFRQLVLLSAAPTPAAGASPTAAAASASSRRIPTTSKVALAKKTVRDFMDLQPLRQLTTRDGLASISASPSSGAASGAAPASPAVASFSTVPPALPSPHSQPSLMLEDSQVKFDWPVDVTLLLRVIVSMYDEVAEKSCAMLEELFKAADENGDGILQFGEFCHLLNQTAARATGDANACVPLKVARSIFADALSATPTGVITPKMFSEVVYPMIVKLIIQPLDASQVLGEAAEQQAGAGVDDSRDAATLITEETAHMAADAQSSEQVIN